MYSSYPIADNGLNTTVIVSDSPGARIPFPKSLTTNSSLEEIAEVRSRSRPPTLVTRNSLSTDSSFASTFPKKSSSGVNATLGPTISTGGINTSSTQIP